MEPTFSKMGRLWCKMRHWVTLKTRNASQLTDWFTVSSDGVTHFLRENIEKELRRGCLHPVYPCEGRSPLWRFATRGNGAYRMEWSVFPYVGKPPSVWSVAVSAVECSADCFLSTSIITARWHPAKTGQNGMGYVKNCTSWALKPFYSGDDWWGKSQL